MHVERWRDDLGLTEARILEVATASRRRHPDPPDGPKALDRAMARAARQDAAPARPPPGPTPRQRRKRELVGSIDADLDDATDQPDLLHPDDYGPSQIFGTQRRVAGSNGITWPSIRYPRGQCIAVFWPDVIPIPVQGAHFAYHWNGAAVDYVKRLDNGAVMAVVR